MLSRISSEPLMSISNKHNYKTFSESPLASLIHWIENILECFISNFKLKYEDSENIKADRVNIVIFNLH